MLSVPRGIPEEDTTTATGLLADLSRGLRV